MADVDSKPSTASTTSSSTFNLSAYRESAAFLLTFLAPPAAIAVRQGKVDLESRHLALSLALYLSVICYLPAVVHAYWLLYVRDNGGVEEWTGARVRQARGLWNEHGGIVKAKVDEYSPMVIEKYEIVRSYANYATAKKDEAWSFVTGVISAVRELYKEAREAYAAGTAIDWAKEKMHVVVEKVIEKYEGVRSYATAKKDEAWSFVTGVISAVRELFEEAREAYAAGTAIDWAKEKMHVGVEKAANDDHEGTDSTVESPKSTVESPKSTVESPKITAESPKSTVESPKITAESPKSTRTTEEYETAEDQESTMDESFNEGKTEHDLSQEL